MRLGIVYDPYRISKVQKQGAISLGVEFYAKLQVSCRASILAVQVVILTLMFLWCWSMHFNDENL